VIDVTLADQVVIEFDAISVSVAPPRCENGGAVMKVITNVNFGKKEEEGLTFYEPEIIDYVLVTGSPVEINEMMEFMGWLTAGATTRQNAASRYASLCLETLRSTCTSSLARNWLSWKRAPTRNPAPPWFSYLPLQMLC